MQEIQYLLQFKLIGGLNGKSLFKPQKGINFIKNGGRIRAKTGAARGFFGPESGDDLA